MSKHYDLFISYAREDSEWVKNNLYNPILRCRRDSDGQQPIVFLDVGKHGIGTENWVNALEEGLQNSKRVVAVYSCIYFKKEMCEWELTKVFIRDPNGTRGVLVPILIEPAAASLVPLRVSQIMYTDVNRTDWFDRICGALELTQPSPEQKPIELVFLDQPSNVEQNRTFSQLRIELKNNMDNREEMVCLIADGSGLQGTTTVRTDKGIAIFKDLSISIEVPSVRLIATAPGCVAGISDYFSVTAPKKPPPPENRVTDNKIIFDSIGDAYFFPDEQAVAMIEKCQVTIFNMLGKQLNKFSLNSELRMIRFNGNAMAGADWLGGVHLVFSDGRYQSWNLRETSNFTISGDLCISSENIHIGFWDGRVYGLKFGCNAPVSALYHSQGVQALAVIDTLLYICGLDGGLCVYRGNNMVRSFPLESPMRLLKSDSNSVMGVGEKTLYYHSKGESSVHRESPACGEITTVLGETDFPILIDAHGKGICINQRLDHQYAFYTAAGAVPLTADRLGKLCVLRNPDNSYSLMNQGKVTFTHSTGILSVSPSASFFAIGANNKISIVNVDSKTCIPYIAGATLAA